MPKMTTKHETLAQSLAGVNSTPEPDGPLWLGPEAGGPRGGITFSMLSRFLTCRERFRVKYLEGWSPPDDFNHKIEYGQMWHCCEEALAAGKPWDPPLKEYSLGLCRKYPTRQELIEHWWQVCRTQFPVYVAHWARHPDVVARRPVEQEGVFDVRYSLPSGRVVRLRGKRDSVDLVGAGRAAGIWLQENKTKGDVDPIAMQRQLTGDLQTMMYLVAARNDVSLLRSAAQVAGTKVSPEFVGVRYNVVRRPLSGGEGDIKRKKGSKNVMPETAAEFYARLRSVIDGTGTKQNGEPYAGPEHWFMRWEVRVSKDDVSRFRERTLDPILESLCNWYKTVATRDFLGQYADYGHHWQHPFGCVNTLDEYGSTDLDDYLLTGSTVGLVRSQSLFRELQ